MACQRTKLVRTILRPRYLSFTKFNTMEYSSNKFDLDKLPKENIFQVPDGYFEELPMRIQARTSAKTSATSLVSWSARRTWASIAACTLVATLGYFTLIPRQESIGEESLSGVKIEEIEGYLVHQNIHQVDYIDHIDEAEADVSTSVEGSEMLDELKLSSQDIIQSIDIQDVPEDI